MSVSASHGAERKNGSTAVAVTASTASVAIGEMRPRAPATIISREVVSRRQEALMDVGTRKPSVHKPADKAMR